MEPQAAMLSAVPPALRMIAQHLGSGPKAYASVGSAEAMDAMIRDLRILVSYRKTTLMPEEIAALDGVIDATVHNMYTSCRREVWWTAREVAETRWWDRETFEQLEAFRRGTGMTPSWWHPFRKLRDSKDLRRVAELCVFGRVAPRWQNWWLHRELLIFSVINLLTFPASLPVAFVWRMVRLRGRSKRAVGAFRDRQRGDQTLPYLLPRPVDTPYWGWMSSPSAETEQAVFLAREADLLGIRRLHSVSGGAPDIREADPAGERIDLSGTRIEARYVGPGFTPDIPDWVNPPGFSSEFQREEGDRVSRMRSPLRPHGRSPD